MLEGLAAKLNPVMLRSAWSGVIISMTEFVFEITSRLKAPSAALKNYAKKPASSPNCVNENITRSLV